MLETRDRRRRRSACSSARRSSPTSSTSCSASGRSRRCCATRRSPTSSSTATTRSTSSANGKLEETDVVFKDDKHLMQIIERIVSSVGRRIDESSPMVDARLADGSRVNAIIPPLALDGPALSIRRFRTDRLGAQDLVERDSLTAADARLPARRRSPAGSTSSCRAAPAPARRRCSTCSRASSANASASSRSRTRPS